MITDINRSSPTFNDIFEIQIDVTSYCNSFCGSCIRNINGGPLNPRVKLEHMSWTVWKHIIEYCKKYSVSNLSFNGNYGDLSNHPEIIEMLEYLYSQTPGIAMTIHTNGGARNIQFWKDLATITKKFPSTMVVFSIDGLEDTNHVYRRGVKFDSIMENANSFISAGGNARWRMIVFDHNKHQIQEASQLARAMKFCAFNLNRSFSASIEVDKYKEFPQEVITAPTSSEVNKLNSLYAYSSIESKNNVVRPFSTFESKCPWQQEFKIQINQLGEVWPCCYLSMASAHPSKIRFNWLDEKKIEYGEGFNNLKYFTLTEILDHPFFQNYLPNTFENNPLIICKEKCNL